LAKNININGLKYIRPLLKIIRYSLLLNPKKGKKVIRILEKYLILQKRRNYRIIGQRWGKIYRLGDKIRLKVKKIDLQKKQMDFDLVKPIEKIRF